MPDAEASLALPTVEVLLPRALVDLFPGAPRRLELAAPTVAAMIDELDMRWPGMADRLRDSSPRIRRHLNIFVAGRRATGAWSNATCCRHPGLTPPSRRGG